MSYYSEPNLSYQQERASSIFSQTVAGSSSQHPNEHGDDGDQNESTRYCSVRGCTSVLPLNYGNKMCDMCRGRHRVYASTKRAKRKMEKAALGMQNGWTPGGEGAQDLEVSTSSSNALPGQETASPEQASQSFIYSGGTSWDTALDPRLFQPASSSSSSELAGALILPASTTARSRSPAHAQVAALHPSSSVPPPEAGGPDGSGSVAYPSFQQPRVPTPQQSKGEISVQSISEVAAIQPDGSLPPRFCSIKGCKTVMDGSSLFKMCETCRGKYKTYGNTKRKKWKEEKAKAVAEMERQREEQNRIRTEQGLPPLPAVNTLAWPEDNLTGRAVNTSIPRMCTVSHCREILPIGYEYLRCERHRIQNRHHSKLKRVRDKDAKAQALEGWFATLTDDAMSGSQMVYQSAQPYEPSEPSLFEEDSSGETAPESSMGDVLGMEEQKCASVLNVSVSVVEPQVIVRGVPPAARGVRRTNHVCTIKGCHNLLSPSTPWKMCDDCRAHERTVRKIRALRESGVMVEPLPPRMPPRERKEKVPKEKKVKNSDGGKNRDGEHTSHSELPELNDVDGDGSGLVFMDPVLLDEDTDAPESVLRANGEISFIMADQEGNFTGPLPPAQSTREETEANRPPLAPIPAQTESAPASVPKKKTAKKKDTVKSSNAMAPTTETTQPQAATSSTSAAATTSPPASHPTPETPTQHPPPLAPYGLPYYMPPPGYGMPYPPPSAPYPYAAPPPPHHLPHTFPRDGFAPSSMYQPPYPTYPGYPPPYPPPYGYYPHPYPYPPPPPPPVPVTQPSPPQAQATPIANESVSAGPPATASASTAPVATPATYNVGITTYMTASSGSSATNAPAPSPWFPPPPPDPSTMYSMFPVRLTDTSQTERTSTSTSAATASPSAPPQPANIITTLSTSEKHKQTEMIFVDKPPEKRKRRKADLAAVEAYLKRREEKARAEQNTPGEQNQLIVEATQSQALPPPMPNVQPMLPATPAPMAADGPDVTAAGVEQPSELPALIEAQSTRPCGNKLCSRTLSAVDTGTICGRCKEKIKKRAVKMKKRFKLVKSASPVTSKLLAKTRSEPKGSMAGVDDEDEDTGMEEVMVGLPEVDALPPVSSTTVIGVA